MANKIRYNKPLTAGSANWATDITAIAQIASGEVASKVEPTLSRDQQGGTDAVISLSASLETASWLSRAPQAYRGGRTCCNYKDAAREDAPPCTGHTWRQCQHRHLAQHKEHHDVSDHTSKLHRTYKYELWGCCWRCVLWLI